MSSPPESSAAARLAVLDDPLFRQVKDVYSFFKRPIGTKGKNITPEELAAYNEAYGAILRAERGPMLVGQVWDEMSRPQHELFLELLLKQYCDSRADPEDKSLPVPASALDPFKHLDTLLDLIVTLYSAPIDGREGVAFKELLGDVHAARRHLARATSTTPQFAGRAQGVLDAAKARLDERLKRANDARVVRLQQVKAAFSLLHDSASLVTGSADNAHQAAVEVYFSRLDPGQQAAVVARVRDFVFAACEERAVRGEALDPNAHLADIFEALHARDLGHALCAARLSSMLYFYTFEKKNVSDYIIEHVQGVLNQFCSAFWTHRFPQLALSRQLRPVAMTRSLLKHIRTLPDDEVRILTLTHLDTSPTAMSSPPASPPASSAAAPVVEPDDPLFRQVKDMYSFFKDTAGTARRDKTAQDSCTPEEFARRVAGHALNMAALRAPPLVAQEWSNMSRAQHEHMLELLLEYYCGSRADLDRSPPPISFKEARDRNIFQRLDKLLRLLVSLYDAPIAVREFMAFQELRDQVREARSVLSKAKKGHSELEGHAQDVVEDAEARLAERLSEVNAERVEHVQQVKAMFSLLYVSAALVTGMANADQHAAVEVYFSRLSPVQQADAVALVRDFLFAACEERAVRGEALDPDAHLVEILHALHAYDLGHALCTASLKSIVRWVQSRSAPPDFVEPFQDVVDQFCGDVWAHRFPRLAPSQQLYAVNMVRALLGRIHTLKPRQVINELAVILPMHSSDRASWKHAHEHLDSPSVS
ncbi:hypothetical protein JCM9279_001380 [Rhodotorula babjevae]